MFATMDEELSSWLRGPSAADVASLRSIAREIIVRRIRRRISDEEHEEGTASLDDAQTQTDVDLTASSDAGTQTASSLMVLGVLTEFVDTTQVDKVDEDLQMARDAQIEEDAKALLLEIEKDEQMAQDAALARMLTRDRRMAPKPMMALAAKGTPQQQRMFGLHHRFGDERQPYAARRGHDEARPPTIMQRMTKPGPAVSTASSSSSTAMKAAPIPAPMTAAKTTPPISLRLPVKAMPTTAPHLRRSQ